MFYRASGIRHTTYLTDRSLWPLPFDRYLVGLVVVVLLAAPWVVNSLYLGTYMLPWLVWASATLGLNLLIGGAGQVHLGYGAVMAIGAYSAVHLARMGLPFELVLIAAGLLSAVIGVLFGAAALRVKGLYLAISTLAMQYLVDFVISHSAVISGGTQSTINVPPFKVLGIQIVSDMDNYYLALLVCGLITVFMLNVQRTSFGRALAAIREKDYAAEIIGVSTFRFKLLAFWVSSFIGGVVGCLFAFCYYKAVTPEQFHLELSIQLVAAVIVGGVGSVLGCFFGAALILLAPVILNNLIGVLSRAFELNVSADVTAHAPLMLYGTMIVGFLLFEPLGLSKIYHNIRNYFLVWPFRHARR